MSRGRRGLESLLVDMFTDAAQALYDHWKQGRPGPPQDDDPYRILGVEPGDSEELVKAVFRAKAKVFHPDTGKKPDPEKFARLKAAYDAIQGVNRGNSP